jgi:hypothetical protein
LSSSRGSDVKKKQATGERDRQDGPGSAARTAAAVAAIGASVGAVTLAGKKLLSSRRQHAGQDADESTETS